MVTTAKTAETAAVSPPAVRRSGGSLRRTLSNALIITRREVRDSFRDWRIIAPIVILTFLFPALAQFVAGQFVQFVAGYGADIIGERTIPFMLMIVGFFPISISLVIALETFVGEKERRSLEPLLSTPLTNTELYIGKTLAAMIPPLVASFGGMAVYLFSLVLGDLAWRPQALLVVQIILLTTVQALVMVTGAVVVSSQTTSTRAANLLASFIIIPMALIIQGEAVIMFLAPDAEAPGGISALWAIIVGMIVVVILLLRVGNSIFNREELLGRTLDQLNLKGLARRIWRGVIAVDAAGTPATGLLDWYRRGVRSSVGRLGGAAWVTVIVFVAALLAGYIVGNLPEWRLELPPAVSESAASLNIAQWMAVPVQSPGIQFIIVNNGRILLAAAILGMFTFGVGALVITPLVYFVLGYLYAQVLLLGLDPAFVFAGVLPHGIIEVPVIVLAVASAVRLGAVVTRPPRGLTVGQAWTLAFSDTMRIALGLVIPGLILGAVLESRLTPLVVRAVLAGY